MSFHVTPLRRLRIVCGCGLLVLALGSAGVSFTPTIDAEGRVLCYAGAGLCALLGFLNLWWARRTPAEAMVTVIPDRAPVSEQVRYYRRMLWLSLIAFPALSALSAYELHELESGAADSVRLWAPLAFLYERLGYWPTVLAPMALGLACAALLSSSSAESPPTTDFSERQDPWPAALARKAAWSRCPPWTRRHAFDLMSIY